MIRVRAILLLGVVVGGAGCTSFPMKARTIAPPAEIAEDLNETVATPRPGDPFHAEPVSVSTQFARWFPNLTKLISPPPAPPKLTETRRSETKTTALKRVPVGRVNDAAEESLTIRRNNKTSAPSRHDEDLTSAAPPPPSLPVAIVAESEPETAVRTSASTPSVTRSTPFGSNTGFGPPASTVGLSYRRMPPMPSTNPPAGSKPPTRRALERDEDSQAQLARAEEDRPAEPLLAVSRLHPPAGSMQPAADQKKEEMAPPPADPFAEPAVAKPAPIAEEPPKPDVVEPQARVELKSREQIATREQNRPPAQPRRTRPPIEDADTGGNPVLSGRPRLNQGQISVNREDLPSDVPAALFPKTYYAKGAQGKPADAPKVDPEAEQTSHWKWRPGILKRFWDGKEPVRTTN